MVLSLEMTLEMGNYYFNLKPEKHCQFFLDNQTQMVLIKQNIMNLQHKRLSYEGLKVPI